MNVATQLKRLLDRIGTDIPPPDKTNTGRVLFGIYIWQELERYASQRIKEAWTNAQCPDGICEADDLLRQFPPGEREVTSSKSFSLVVEVKKPAMRVNNEQFLAKLAKRFKVTVPEIEAIAETCKVENKPSLTKRVIERV